MAERTFLHVQGLLGEVYLDEGNDVIPSFCVGFLMESQERASHLAALLSEQVNFVPIATLSRGPADGPSVPAQNVFLVTDWSPEALGDEYMLNAFPGIVLLHGSDTTEMMPDEIICLSDNDRLIENLSVEIMCRLFPQYEQKQLSLESQNHQHLQLLDHIGKELSVFYHNINNPLTILSGNIQLLQMLADSVVTSSELIKPITDISDITSRLEQDLKAISNLREKIKAEKLQKTEQ